MELKPQLHFFIYAAYISPNGDLLSLLFDQFDGGPFRRQVLLRRIVIDKPVNVSVDIYSKSNELGVDSERRAITIDGNLRADCDDRTGQVLFRITVYRKFGRVCIWQVDQ